MRGKNNTLTLPPSFHLISIVELPVYAKGNRSENDSHKTKPGHESKSDSKPRCLLTTKLAGLAFTDISSPSSSPTSSGGFNSALKRTSHSLVRS